MAKKADKPADAPEGEGAVVADQKSTQVDKPEPKTHDIVLLVNRQVGDVLRKAGEKLATVTLEADVSLGYLTRAVQDDLAGIAPVAE